MPDLTITIPDTIHPDILQAFRTQYNMLDPTETTTDPETGEETQTPREPTQAELGAFFEGKVVEFVEKTYMAHIRDQAVQPVREQAEEKARNDFAPVRPDRGRN